MLKKKEKKRNHAVFLTNENPDWVELNVSEITNMNTYVKNI